IAYEGKSVKIERRKALALAAFLAIAEQRQSREVVASLLWSDLDNEHARSALRSTLRALTTPIPVEWIVADRMTLGLKREAVWVDVNAFTDLLAQTNTHAHSVDVVCEECIELYKQAIDLYEADFLKGFHLPDSAEYEDWQLAQREWLRREVADIHRRLSSYYAESGQYHQAIKYEIGRAHV